MSDSTLDQEFRLIPVGVVGIGRLGGVLARELLKSVPVWGCDVDAKRLDLGVDRFRARDFRSLAASADIVFLCTASDVTVALLREAAAANLTRPAYVCLATDLAVAQLSAQPDLTSLRIIGLKMIGMFKSIEYGIPVQFVTSSPESETLGRIRNLLATIGAIEVGNEGAVRELNRVAARAALSISRELINGTTSLALPPNWVAAALKNVLVGTVLDYPPERDNPYTNAILSELDATRGG